MHKMSIQNTSILSYPFFEFLDGYLNAYTPEGRRNQIREIIEPILEEASSMWARELCDLIREKFPRWYRRSWYEFLRAFFYSLYFYRNRPTSAIVMACDIAGTTIGTARLVFYYLYRCGVDYAYEYYRTADELRRIDEYNTLRYVRAVGSALQRLALEAKSEDRTTALRYCVRRCMSYFRHAGRRRRITAEWIRKYCTEICRERVS